MADAPYPNNLRAKRLAAFFTREQLAAKTAELGLLDSVKFTPVSARSLERLERGEHRPKIRTAASLAKALDVEPTLLFPLGPDHGKHNADGNTRVPENRRLRGKAKPKAIDQ